MDILLDIVSDDQRLITYRPKLRKIAKSVTATILLQQMLHWWKSQGRQPFFKFKEKCDHKAYRPGDSWTEELGFSSKEFSTAIKKIGYKKGKRSSFKKIEEQKAFVLYYTDKDRMTWYEINEKAILDAIKKSYLVSDQSAVTNEDTNGKLDSKLPKGSYPSTETTTKNTTKNTSAKQTENAEQDDKANLITDTKPRLNNAETIPSDTNPDTDKAEHSRSYFLDKIHNEIQNTKINAKYKEELMAQLKKESFVAGQVRSKLIDDMDDKDFCAFYELLSSDETNFLHSDYWRRFGSIELDSEPPKINRSNLRKNHKIKLPQENFYDLLDYRDAGFGGKADIVDAYVQHEMKLWDFKKTPLKDAVVFFQKEICLGHPVARHYLNMTPEQRQRELELYAQ